MQAYYNITGQKLNAVVCKSSWQKKSQYASTNESTSPALVARFAEYNASIQKIVNKIGIQYPDQNNSIMQQWHSVVAQTCSATEINNILIALMTLESTPAQLQTITPPTIDSSPTYITDLDTLSKFHIGSDYSTNSATDIYSIWTPGVDCSW